MGVTRPESLIAANRCFDEATRFEIDDRQTADALRRAGTRLMLHAYGFKTGPGCSQGQVSGGDHSRTKAIAQRAANSNAISPQAPASIIATSRDKEARGARETD